MDNARSIQPPVVDTSNSTPRVTGIDPRNLTVPGKPKASESISPSVSTETTPVTVPSVQSGQYISAAEAPMPEIPLPYNLHRRYRFAASTDGKVFCIETSRNNPRALPIRSKKFLAIVRSEAQATGKRLTKVELDSQIDTIEGLTLEADITEKVWLRVAKIDHGIEIDVGDANDNRVKITPGGVEVLRTGSATVFRHSDTMLCLALPGENGDWRLLDKYVNVAPSDFHLLIAWISYTIAHPKTEDAKYPILVLQGGEGTGKTTLCKLLAQLIDPSGLGSRRLPSNEKDLAIATQSAHLLCFDNMRSITPAMADAICVAATGGSIASRQLYTDDEEHALRLHSAMILNGIHQFIDQPDLAQRCLPLRLRPIDRQARKSEHALNAELAADFPAILGGLYNLIAGILAALPKVEVTNPERMIEFVEWIAAMEQTEGVPPGIFQALYSEALQNGQLDTLMDNPLAAAIIEFMDNHHDDKYGDEQWSGTPTAFLQALNFTVDPNTVRSRDWPRNAIALSKRIPALQASLLSQGIKIELSRGKNRAITLTKVEV